MRRVVVTGLGVVSALGLDRAAHFEALREGRSGHRRVRIRDIDRLSIRIGQDRQKSFAARTISRNPQLALYDRTTQLALVAAQEASRTRAGDRRGAVAARRRCARHRAERHGDHRRQLPRRVRGGEEPRPSLRRAAADDQRGREPHLDAPRPARSVLDGDHRLRLLEPRHRTGDAGDPFRRGGRDGDGRGRGAAPPSA
jgi:hypothetical protein